MWGRAGGALSLWRRAHFSALANRGNAVKVRTMFFSGRFARSARVFGLDFYGSLRHAEVRATTGRAF